MTATLPPWVAAMYESAQRSWPDLTVDQFRDAGNDWLSRYDSSRGWSLQDVADGVYRELCDRYGEPVTHP